MNRYFVALSVAGAGLFACDSDEKTAEVVGTPMTIGCVWNDFDATVRSGPNAGTSVRGRLVLGLSEGTNDLYGHLHQSNGEVIAVSGLRGSNDVALTFEASVGLIEGNGPIAGLAAFCKEGLTGPLTGPTAQDAGDWVGVGLISYDLDEYGGTQDPPPSGLGPDGTVDFGADRAVSPACSDRTKDNGDMQITCSTNNPNGTFTTCTTTYPANGSAPKTVCNTTAGPRPGLFLE